MQGQRGTYGQGFHPKSSSGCGEAEAAAAPLQLDKGGKGVDRGHG